MMNRPMMMTTNDHLTNLNLLKQFYANPKMFSGSSKTKRANNFCDVEVFGPTAHRFGGLDENCNEVLSYRKIRAELEPFKNDDSVENVFMEFDGPGGEAAGCFDLANYIREFAKIKPVIGFINGNCFSANYALASACTELYISPHSLAGSIGVIYGRCERIDEKSKITYFKTGEAKDDGATTNTLTDEESARHQARVDELGEAFFDLVAKNRGVKAIDVKNLQAGIFSANAFLKHGLVNGIKTEEEIKIMMTDKAHKKVLDAVNATHSAETTLFKNQITELQVQLETQGEKQTSLTTKINNLAKSAGLPELAGQLIEQNVDEEAAALILKNEAAKKDEEISLISGLEGTDEGSYDMQQLIMDA